MLLSQQPSAQKDVLEKEGDTSAMAWSQVVLCNYVVPFMRNTCRGTMVLLFFFVFAFRSLQTGSFMSFVSQEIFWNIG